MATETQWWLEEVGDEKEKMRKKQERLGEKGG